MKMSTKISLKNFIILLLIVVLVLSSFELYLRHTALIKKVTISPIDIEQLYLMSLEKASVDELISSSFGIDMFSLDLQKSDSVYPLIKSLPSGNSYNSSTKNIVVIGDSFVWGASILNRNEFFWRLVENDLRNQGYNCRIYAVGVAGANAYEELNWLIKTTLVEDLDPDLVLFGYVYNDVDPDSYEGGSRISLADTSSRIPFTSILRKIIPNIYAKLNNYVVSRTMYTDKQFDKISYFLPENSNMPIYINKGKIYEKYKNEFVIPLNNYANDVDFPIICMTLPPSPSYNLQKALFKPLHTLYSEYTSVAFYDCLDEFYHDFASLKHSANYYVSPFDFHPGSATNRFYADYIENMLKTDFPEVLGISTGKSLVNDTIFINECMPSKIDLLEEDRTYDSVTYSLNYPSGVKKYSFMQHEFTSYFLQYPLGKNYIKLSFAQPIDIKSIEISGDKVQNIDLYYTRINESLNYDDQMILPYSKASNDSDIWMDSTSDLVTSLCIHAECINNDGAKLTVKINK